MLALLKRGCGKHILTMVACLLIAGIVSISLGQDINWDLRNYHLYNPFSVLNDRNEKDIFVAGIQSDLMPLLDIPYYFFSQFFFADSPRIVAFFAGLPYGILIFLARMVSKYAISDLNLPTKWQAIFVPLSVLIGVTGFATYSQIGTITNEIQIACFILAGIVIVMAINEHKNIKQAVLIAGIMYGMAAGLKLTAVIYAPAFAIALPFLLDVPIRKIIGYIILFSMAWLLTFLVVYGWWGWHLYQVTGNPINPFFGSAINPEWMGKNGFSRDTRFLPKGIYESFFYPVFWAFSSEPVVSEIPFKDSRFLAGLIASLSIFIYFFIERFVLKIRYKNRILKFLLIFWVVGYIVWLFMFSIIRYAIPLEIFTGILLVCMLDLILRKVKHSQLKLLVVCVASFYVVFTTVRSDWGRIEFGKSYFEISKLEVKSNAMFVFSTENRTPFGYLVPYINKQHVESRYIGLRNATEENKDSMLGKKIAKAIKNHQWDMYAIVHPHNTEEQYKTILSNGLRIDGKVCQVLYVTNGRFFVCPVERI